MSRSAPPLLLASLIPLLIACGDAGDGAATGPDAGDDRGDAAPPDAPREPDAGPIDPGVPLDRAHAGGMPAAVRLDGARAYVAVGPRVAIWDVSAPGAATFVGESAPLSGVIADLAVDGDHLLASTWTGGDGRVHLVDVRDPAHPVETTSFRFGDGASARPLGMALDGDRLFVADGVQGVLEIDLAAPVTPTVVAHAGDVAASGLHRAGARLYATGTSLTGIWIAALDPDDELARLGGAALPGASAVAVTPSHLAVAVGASGIRVVDLADPGAPVERFATPVAGTRVAIGDGGAVAYVTADDGVHVLDLATPAAITRTGPFPVATTGAAAVTAPGGALAVITDRGDLVVADLTDPRAPAPRSTTAIEACGSCSLVATDGAAVTFAATGTAATGVVATAGLADLAGVGRAVLPGASLPDDLAVAGGIAYVADRRAGLRIVDVTDPAAPVPVTTIVTGGAPTAVEATSTRLYVGEATDGGTLRVYDRSTATAPVELGSIRTQPPRALAVDGSLVYVVDQGDGVGGALRVFRADDPAAITLLGELAGCAASAVAVDGAVAVLACGSKGFVILDVTDPTNPTRAATWPVPERGHAWSVAVRGGRAYLGHSFGVIVLEIATPASPALVAELDTAALVRAIAVPLDGRVVAAAGIAGAYQWQVD